MSAHNADAASASPEPATGPRPYASLSSGLLARKGLARPAMRPQPFVDDPTASTLPDALEDLGWNDMGEPARPAHPALRGGGLSPMTAPAAHRAVHPGHPIETESAFLPLPETALLETPLPETAIPETALAVHRQQALVRARFGEGQGQDQGQDRLTGEAKGMGDRPVPPIESPADSGVADANLVDAGLDPALLTQIEARLPVPPCASGRARPGSKKRTAFTLRLDPQRRLHLRLLCAVTGQSAQHAVLCALDDYFNTHPPIGVLAHTLVQR